MRFQIVVGVSTRLAVAVLAVVLFGSSAASAAPQGRDGGPDRDQREQLRAFPELKYLAFDDSGIPTVITGRLGHVGFGPVERSAHRFVARLVRPLFRGTGEETFRTLRVGRDKEGFTHLRMEQELRGLPIVGAELVLHVEESTGQVKGLNGRFIPADGLATEPKLESGAALESALREANIAAPQLLESPQLTYVVDRNGTARLAFAARVAYWSDQGLETDRIFADAIDGSLAARHPEVWRAKYRKIYTANNGSSLPGTLLYNEGGTSSDFDANKAYEYSGNAYDYFSARHGRDSWNGSGGNLISTVHWQSGYNNANWTNNQMAFGDGDGVTFTGLARGLDIVAHEMTHGVTQATANLTYSNESGAMNESMSDIFGAAAEARVRGVSASTWKIGEDVYTPGVSGDALRYMNTPVNDGSSRDYYPERYTGGADNGGVHWNSGISNLAFYLASQGGTHPRGKTSNSVPAAGMTTVEKIFYRALTWYMTSSTNFTGARHATLAAADNLHGNCGTPYNAVYQAWDAVGVPRGNPAGRDHEPNDSLVTNNPLSGYNAYVVGYLCTSGNADWFSIQKINSYSNLSISLYPPAASDYDMEFWYSSMYGQSINTGNGVPEYINWSYGAGTYYIKVFGKNGAYNSGASYSLSISQ